MPSKDPSAAAGKRASPHAAPTARARPRPVTAIEAYETLRTTAGLPSQQARIPLLVDLLVERLRLAKEAEPWTYPLPMVTADEREAIASHFQTSTSELRNWWQAAGLGERPLVRPFQWADSDQQNAERHLRGERLESLSDWPGMTDEQRNCAWVIYEQLERGPAIWDDSLTGWPADHVQAPAVRYLLWSKAIVTRAARLGDRRGTMLALASDHND